MSAIDSYADEAQDVGKQIEQTTVNAFKGMEDALVGFVQTGKLSFNDLANSIISDIMRIVIRSQITGPLGNALGSAIGNIFGSGGGEVAAIHASSASVTNPFSMLHTGGIIGGDSSGNKHVSPSVFGGADRYHSGGMIGLGPNEVPIIGLRGEEVLTQADPRHRDNLHHASMPVVGSGGDVDIIINDQRGAGAEPIKPKERTGPDGRRVIEMTILETVAKGIESGRFDGAMHRSFGARRQGVTR
jgi:lambda family phage tail tape measure protein